MFTFTEEYILKTNAINLLLKGGNKTKNKDHGHAMI
jgi:hypothetical protein